MDQTIPQTDPRAGYLARRREIDAAIARVLDSGRYILGDEVEGLEREFAAYIGVQHAIGAGNGTDALYLALKACGIGVGDLVLTVSHTAVATVTAIVLCGAAPVFVDIDPATFTMDPDCLQETIRMLDGGRLKAVVPVHLYGLPADMKSIGEIASWYGLRIVEDCAQSHGAVLAGKKTGGIGDIAAFSFYPTKNLGALGDGGIVTTGDPELANRVRCMREYGWGKRHISTMVGTNSRLDEIQAAILRVKLRYHDSDNSARRRIAGLYNSLLKDSRMTLPQGRIAAEHVYHQYVVRTGERDLLREHLRGKGIGTLVHYPVPVHLQPAYSGYLGKVGTLSHTERIAAEVMSLPMYPELDDANVRRTCADIYGWMER